MNNATTLFERLSGIERTIEVDLIFAVETENDQRGILTNTPKLKSMEMPANVRIGVNLAAKNGLWPGMLLFTLDIPGNPQNGLNHLGNALNFELNYLKFPGHALPHRMDHETIYHLDEMALNPDTLTFMTEYIYLAVYGERRGAYDEQ